MDDDKSEPILAGRLMRETLDERCWTQEKLAEESGLAINTISRIANSDQPETGKEKRLRSINFNTRSKLAKTLDDERWLTVKLRVEQKTTEEFELEYLKPFVYPLLALLFWFHFRVWRYKASERVILLRFKHLSEMDDRDFKRLLRSQRLIVVDGKPKIISAEPVQIRFSRIAMLVICLAMTAFCGYFGFVVKAPVEQVVTAFIISIAISYGFIWLMDKMADARKLANKWAVKAKQNSGDVS